MFHSTKYLLINIIIRESTGLRASTQQMLGSYVRFTRRTLVIIDKFSSLYHTGLAFTSPQCEVVSQQPHYHGGVSVFFIAKTV